MISRSCVYYDRYLTDAAPCYCWGCGIGITHGAMADAVMLCVVDQRLRMGACFWFLNGSFCHWNWTSDFEDAGADAAFGFTSRWHSSIRSCECFLFRISLDCCYWKRFIFLHNNKLANPSPLTLLTIPPMSARVARKNSQPSFIIILKRHVSGRKQEHES